MTGSPRHAELLREAEQIHRALFRRPMPPIVGERYVAAHAFHCVDPEASSKIQLILRERLDLEAVEFALRKRDPAITRKAQIVLYAVETLPEYQDDLVNARDRRAAAWLILGMQTIRSAWKLLKGKIASRRHGL